MLRDFKTYYKDIKSRQCRIVKRQTDQQNRELRNTPTHIWLTDFLTTVKKQLNGEKTVLSTNDTGTTGHPYVKKLLTTYTSHLI